MLDPPPITSHPSTAHCIPILIQFLHPPSKFWLQINIIYQSCISPCITPVIWFSTLFSSALTVHFLCSLWSILIPIYTLVESIDGNVLQDKMCQAINTGLELRSKSVRVKCTYQCSMTQSTHENSRGQYFILRSSMPWKSNTDIWTEFLYR